MNGVCGESIRDQYRQLVASPAVVVADAVEVLACTASPTRLVGIRRELGTWPGPSCMVSMAGDTLRHAG